MKETVKLKSGRTLELGMASFKDGEALLKAVVRELKGVQIEVDQLNLKMDLAALDPKTLNLFKNAICQLIGSDAIASAMTNCLGRCLYEGERLTMDAFESPDTRQDYLPVAWEVVRYNLAPFFKGIDFALLAPKPTPDAAPK